MMRLLLLCTAFALALAAMPAHASAKTPGGTAAPPESGLVTQTAIVDWRGGDFKDRETRGFNLPGIGYGRLVCRPNAQYIRVYPSRLSRETSMLNWTYRDWGKGNESAIREDLKTKFTGRSFAEGLNKFGPLEKTSTGQFDGIVSDRGPADSSGATALAAPTTFRLTWEWNFEKDGNERCYAKAVFTSERKSSEKTPLARSGQIIWRGDANAPNNDSSITEIPGIGRMTLTCHPGFFGERSILIDTPAGATVTTREGSESETAPQPLGPVTTDLPNNSMIFISFDDGRRVVLSSRWKVNDPDGSKNFCAIAAQATVP